MRNFCFGDRDPREMRDTANGGGIDRHDIWPLNGEFSPPYSRGCFCTATAGTRLVFQSAYKVIFSVSAPGASSLSHPTRLYPSWASPIVQAGFIQLPVTDGSLRGL